MKKILIGTGYAGAAFVFLWLILYGIGGMLGQFAAPDALAGLLLGLTGFGMFLAPKAYRMRGVLFVFWFIWLLVCAAALPRGVLFDLKRTFEALYDPQRRIELLSGGFYCAWCIFGMAQVFIRQPPRDAVIIVHSTLSVLIYGVWRLFIR